MKAEKVNYFVINGVRYDPVKSERECDGCCFFDAGVCNMQDPDGFHIFCEDPFVFANKGEVAVEAAAEQRLAERSEEETGEADKEAESKEPEEKKTGKASGADAIALDKTDKNFVFTGTFKADRIKREGNIGKRSYYGFPNGVEAEDICRYLPFNLGNVVKYVCRAGRKDPGKKALDLRKAMDYLENEIKRLEEGDD
jgi:hypothetical protein